MNKKGKVPKTSMEKTRTRADLEKEIKQLRGGLVRMMANIKVLHTVIEKMKFYKQPNEKLEKEFSLIISTTKMMFDKYFDLPRGLQSKIWNSINEEWMQKEAERVFNSITKKIVMPGDKGFKFEPTRYNAKPSKLH